MAQAAIAPERPRLLWLSHFVPYPPTGHGALQRSHHLVREASRRSDVHLVALSPPSAELSPKRLEQAVAALSRHVSSVTVFPLPIDRYRVRRALCAARACVGPDSFWQTWYWSQPMHRHVRQLARTLRFDLVHVDIIFLARYLDAVGDVPVVLNHHNVESHLLERRAAAHHAPWGRAFFDREARKVRALERTVVPRVARNIVVSDLDGDRLRNEAPNARITTVANGVDVEFFRTVSPVDAEAGTMVFAGGMDWFPNRDAITHFLLDIWPALVQDGPHRTMTIIGRNPPPALREAAARDSRLRVLGFVDDVRPYIMAASTYVCPIRVGGGTRLKILDALAMSRPIVSTEIGVEGLGLTEGEHYLRADTPADFVTQMRRLEGDPLLRRRLGEAAREFVVRRYSWQRIAESLEDAYARAMHVA